jgi:hypothetical protein
MQCGTSICYHELNGSIQLFVELGTSLAPGVIAGFFHF